MADIVSASGAPAPVPPPEVIQKLRAKAEQNLSDLSSELAVGEEWSLFGGDDSNKADSPRITILNCIKEAQQALLSNNFAGAELWTLRGRGELCRAQMSRPIWFIANARFGTLPLLFTALSAWLAYWIAFEQLLQLPFAQAKMSPMFLGFVGAILKSLYWLQFQINKGLLRPRWFAYFLVAPFVGIILGGVSALIVKVGFKLLTTNANQEMVPDWKTVGLVAAFAGFNWEWALEKFKGGAEAVTKRLSETRANSSR